WNEVISKGIFSVSGGSGHFHVENIPSSGAPVSVALRSRIITVTPKNHGQISLRVADSCLLGQYADALVRIADIHSLAIDAPQF
uniref:NUP210 Ig-like domain-containing protein n=1 Tax=Caenorhabditis japonica TaxID=281687 RepID=A0A8R1ECM1_CAEJA